MRRSGSGRAPSSGWRGGTGGILTKCSTIAASSAQTDWPRKLAANRCGDIKSLVKMTSCGPMRSLLRDQYKFPYDLAGPAGNCP